MQEKRGRFSASIAILAALFLLSSCISSKQVRLGDEFANENRWEEAYHAYSEALKKDPFDQGLKQKMDEAKMKAAAVHAERAKELMDQKNLPVALEEIKRAMLLDPGRTEYQDFFARTLRKKEAQDDFALGQKLMKAERFTEAIEFLDRALERDPTLPHGQEILAQAINRQRAAGDEADELSLRSTQPITLKFQNARLKEVFELLAKSAGINILFDKDVRDETISIFVKDASFKEAL